MDYLANYSRLKLGLCYDNILFVLTFNIYFLNVCTLLKHFTGGNVCYFFVGVDTMEKGALLSMMSLAVSDLLFCVVTVSGMNMPSTKMIYYEKNFTLYYRMYANCMQNILIKTSTWCTVILATGRYFVVCHPITARKYLKCKHTLAALLTSLTVWICLHIPLFLSWRVETLKCVRKEIHLLVSGIYQDSPTLKMTCTYTWFLVGFVIPVCILGYCNFRLIYSLQLSKQLRSNLSSREKGSHRNMQESIGRNRTGKTSGSASQRRLTYTLIAIVILFFVCFFPSEGIKFYADIQKPEYKGFFRFSVDICNLLQAINFSGNFVLYCIVNAYFRRTLRQWAILLAVGCKKEKIETDFALMDRPLQSKTSLTTTAL